MAKKGQYYIDKAEENGLRVVPGKGSHTKVYADNLPDGLRNPMVIPQGELAPGTEHTIRKWFIALGIIGVTFACAYIQIAYDLFK